MAEVFTTTRRVEFRDTDMARIVHFSVFFTYMEEAEHEFLRQLGFGVVFDVNGRHLSFPRVNAECNYRSAIRFEEVIEIEVKVLRIGTKSVTYGFQFQRGETRVADGEVTAVCCEFGRNHEGPPEPVAIPAEIVTELQPYLAS